MRRIGIAIVAATLVVAACGDGADDARGPTAGPITVRVTRPADWPNPIYPGAPEVTAEAADGTVHRTTLDADVVTLVLPSEGEYRVGAIIGDAGCFDTAGVTDAGNPPVPVADGDTVALRDTGEICD